MKMQDVRAMARERGVNSFGKTKTELIREIQRMEHNFDCYGTATGYCDQLECCFRSSCIQEEKSAPRKRHTHAKETQ
jgi:hypothetical protein